MFRSLSRLVSGILVAAMIISLGFVTNAEAALARPTHCHFEKWENQSFTSCTVAWNPVQGANSYTVQLSYDDGSHTKEYKTAVNSYTFKGLSSSRIYTVKVSASYVNPTTKAVESTSPLSNITFIAPSPTEVSLKIKNKKSISAEVSWNKITGSSGYNIYLATDPSGTWHWNKATATKSSATSAKITKYKGAKLKKRQNYYVRIITRRKRNGQFCKVPLPASNYFNFAFQMAHIR